MAPTVSLEIGFKLNTSNTPIEFSLKTIRGGFSWFQGKISSQSSIRLKDLVDEFDSSLAASIPNDISITLNELLLILSKGSSDQADKSSKILIRLDLGTAINLSNLPLVGKEFSGDRTLAIDNFKILYSSKEFTPNGSIQELFTPNSQQTESQLIPEGLRLAAAMKFGTEYQVLDIAITKNKTNKSQATSEPSLPQKPAAGSGGEESIIKEKSEGDSGNKPAPSSDTVKWFNLKRNFGPLYFSRIGVQYQNSEVWFLLDASISAAGLTLTLSGLAVGSPITQFKPKFNLRGLGVQYESKGALSIGGALLRTTESGRDRYSGAVIVKTEAFALSAIASYTTTDDGHPSLFIYGFLDKSLGGPPFFFVTGLALGFAYNRSLILPTLDQIPQFPLVRMAMGETNLKKLGDIQLALEPHIPPRVGQVMLAIGVKFTSFKIIDSFILLVATFGDQFALDIIGISTLTSPPVLPGIDASKLPPPIAQIRMAILARFVPAEGTLRVDGKILPDSFLFERNCQISGGFAFYSWFKDDEKNKISAGDFVLTVGGYHPQFQIPPHYPKVDPLSLNWRLNDELTIKGSVYFALTASAIMAGGRLEAVWQSGDKKAWFIANAHFIVAWKPYSYDAQISVNVGASYTFDEKIVGIRVRKTFSFDIGASVHIWGPEFSGTATIDLKITSITIAFGNRTQQRPAPISWSEFKQSFLPAHEQVCAISVESGLLRKVERKVGNENKKEEIFIVNPKDFTLTTSSVIPIKDPKSQNLSLHLESKTTSGIEPNTDNFGISPMSVSNTRLAGSEYSISITKVGGDIPEKALVGVPINKNVPSALWGIFDGDDPKKRNDPNQQRFIENVLSGYQIKPSTGGTLGATQPIDRNKLAYDQTSVDDASQWQSSFSAFKQNKEKNENKRQDGIRETINNDNVREKRTNLLQDLGLLDIAIDLQDFEENSIEQAFVISPQLQLAKSSP